MSDVISRDDGWDSKQFFQTIHAALDQAEAAEDPTEKLTLCERVVAFLRDAGQRARTPHDLLRHALGRALSIRGSAKQDAPGIGPMAAIEDYDEAISIWSALIETLGEKCPPDFRKGLAGVFMHRGRAKLDAPGYGPYAALDDWSTADQILGGLAP